MQKRHQTPLIKKTTNAIYVAAALCLLGCGKTNNNYMDEKIDLSIDSNSLAEIIHRMPPDEVANFMNDASLLTALKGGGPYALQGYTPRRVHREAEIGRRYVAEKNREFLRNLINNMEEKGTTEATVFVSNAGIYSDPKIGYQSRTYSLDILKNAYIKNGGNLN